jgi:hypothetical protein
MDKKIATSNEAAIKYFFNYIQIDYHYLTLGLKNTTFESPVNFSNIPTNRVLY